MNIDEIRKFCLSFPDATEVLQWGDALCFKISGKIFAVLGLDNIRLSFKCDPETFSELIELEGIRPSPYLGRYKWVMLERLDALPWNRLKDLIRESHDAVAAKVPAKRARSPQRKNPKKPAGRQAKSRKR